MRNHLLFRRRSSRTTGAARVATEARGGVCEAVGRDGRSRPVVRKKRAALGVPAFRPCGQ